jgi:glutamine amidotransferase
MPGGRVAVVDYGVGNLHSVGSALDLIGADVVVTREPESIAAADRIVLPGVGAFGECMRNLRASGLVDVLDEQVRQRGKPLFGICVGFQVLAREGHELGTHPGLGWIGGTVERFDVERAGLKVPHVGWNEIEPHIDSPLFAGLRRAPTFYFTHSYHVVPGAAVATAASCDYGGRFTAAVLHGNIFATQFHPEKSQENGLRLLENFLAWEP